MDRIEKAKEYDEEPVQYCAGCYSLKIGYEEALDSECCLECGCTTILTTTIDNWEKMYERRYGHKYVTKSKDLKKSPIFMLPIGKLKTKVYQHPKWKEIIHEIYPRFPEGYSKADSVILFFDRLVKDNKLDSLRITFLKKY